MLRARLVLVALIAGIVLSAVAFGESREAQLDELRKRIERLQRSLNETVGERDSARDELQQLERRISELIRTLGEIDQRLAKETRTLTGLERRAERERRAQRLHLAALEAQIRTAFALGRQPHLKVLLNQENPAAAARVLAYYRYFSQARVARIGETHALLVRLEELAQEIRLRSAALAALRETRERERQALEESRHRRAELLAALNRRVAGQTEEIKRLRADEQRLERLVRELKAALPEASASFPGRHRPFASLKGRLPLPLASRVAARYGEPKGVGDLTWRGVFLSAKEGQNVHAVARGRVAFADWLRGFGLLLILDHGDGYMTLYGHNQSLRRQTGDWVEAGQAIATVGNTGDAPAMGVYFEIRYNSVPHDPLQWLAVGRTAPARARR